METLILVVALMLASVLLVGVGDRIRLPWPALMVLLGVAVAVIPGLPDGFEIDPHLILPLFLPPLLFATAQRTSWSLFRARWRSIALLAVALVAATTAVVAGTAMALIPGIGLSAAIALGAMVAPPDPVAVEAVAGSVRIPRRLLAVLQSEGLFNDATALVVFQAAVLATVQGSDLSAGGLLLRFVLGAAGAVLLGLGVAWAARAIVDRITTELGRSALTLVLPFAVYLLAEEVHASGVVAVVVLALQLRATTSADAAQERLMQGSFWDVVELLVTGVAFGLVGLSLREVVTDAGDRLPTMLAHALLIALVAFAVRAVWMAAAVLAVRRSPDATAAPRSGREAVVLTWCGMRGLATLALALSLPASTDDGAAFPARTEILLIACTVLVLTLLLPGFTLPTLVRVLGVAEDAADEHAAEERVVQTARDAAMTTVLQHQHLPNLPEHAAAVLHERFGHLEAVLRGDTLSAEDRERLETMQRTRVVVAGIQADALAAARHAVLQARRQPGVDPEAADRVLRRLDQRTVLLD
ncbi:CPA1 family monovalent cation:H+ antiporter [Kineococcus radiotolerans]|uniref:CPA1 family monovalent cation:H+ antiporter n=1 Tax=Kineococcus radiotolerans TaxID=131568 RepID=A0A7W4TQF5_KINRA|nr:Na+/H+ antiporter [Kineococcus radiotolerans]MBB2903172.1 CPA1 family monovalent cation:H+ antiporter [Kineococcus radiotolerans]